MAATVSDFLPLAPFLCLDARLMMTTHFWHKKHEQLQDTRKSPRHLTSVWWIQHVSWNISYFESRALLFKHHKIRITKLSSEQKNAVDTRETPLKKNPFLKTVPNHRPTGLELRQNICLKRYPFVSHKQICLGKKVIEPHCDPAKGEGRKEGREGGRKEGKKEESEVTQSCLTLCDSMDYSLWGSSIHGILQARVVE